MGYPMDRRIDAHIARTQLGQIMDLATRNDERFIVDRRGEPAVVIISVRDFIRMAAPPPDWLQKAWSGAKRRGLDALAPAETDAEIAAHRRGKKSAGPDESARERTEPAEAAPDDARRAKARNAAANI